jgi:hypothetical protein
MAVVVVAAAATGKPRILVLGSGVGAVVSIVLWLAVPNQGINRLF